LAGGDISHPRFGLGDSTEGRIEQRQRLQRLAQVMARRGEKRALRAIGLFGLVAGIDQRMLDGLPIRDVANGAQRTSAPGLLYQGRPVDNTSRPANRSSIEARHAYVEVRRASLCSRDV
jgi:hypothetical protein